VMDVCRKAQTEIRGSKEISDISPIISSFKNSDTKSLINNDYNSEIVNRIANYNIPQRIHNVESKAEENFGKKFFWD